MQILIRIILIFLSFVAINGYAAEEKHFLGILEELPQKKIDDTGKTHDTYLRQIRVVFYKEGQEWKTPPEQYPSETAWTIAFDSKNLGKIKGRKKSDEENKKDSGWLNFQQINVGAQKIVSKGAIPTIGKRTAFFNDIPVHRPLIANSQPYYSDPDQWKPATLSNDTIQKLQQNFRQKFPTVENCVGANANEHKPWPYQDSDIKISKTYSSNKGWSIADLHLTNRCDEPPQGPFVDQWFVITPTHEIKFLRDQMSLVDAGDYDNGGKSALVFSLDGYNRYGYVIFYDDFKKHAEFENSFQ